MNIQNKADKKNINYNRLLLFIAGLGGLLYGIDVGIIAGALPYLEATSGLNLSELSFIVAAVLLGSVFSTLFAGTLSDWIGRKKMMMISGALFIVSIPVIALSNGFIPLVFGRLLQGISAGFIGVVIPLYLAECLGAANRGKGTGVFQWLLTLGIVAAALIGMGFSLWLEGIEKAGNVAEIFAAKDFAWRSIFWISLVPGVVFFIGCFFVSESPRWLFQKGNPEDALAALLRSRSREHADIEIQEMKKATTETADPSGTTSDSLFQKKYIVPFILACVVLACNQLTGINSIIGYNATILISAGLNDSQAHMGYVILTLVNFLMTMIAVKFVDKKGRTFLLSIGSAGIIVSLICVGFMFYKTESQSVDCKAALQEQINVEKQTLTLDFKDKNLAEWIKKTDPHLAYNLSIPSTLTIIYSYGDFTSSTSVMRSDNPHTKPMEIIREGALPSSQVESLFKNPFGDLEKSKRAPLIITSAKLTPVPGATHGWVTASLIFTAVAFFAMGPGVCVWLALSELMPTRIRSNGMSFALLINQGVSTTIAAVFLPMVANIGYSSIFFAFSAFTVIYFITAYFFLPETMGKTLEEIESLFVTRKRN